MTYIPITRYTQNPGWIMHGNLEMLMGFLKLSLTIGPSFHMLTNRMCIITDYAQYNIVLIPNLTSCREVINV